MLTAVPGRLWAIWARWSRPCAVGAIIVTIAAIPYLTAVWTRIDPFALVDYGNYEGAARRLLSGGDLYATWQSSPYLITDISPSGGFAYAPPAALLFVPFVGYPYAWVAVNLAAFIGALVLVARRRPWVIELCLLLAIFSGSLLQALDYGQITPLVAASLGVAFWRPSLVGPMGCLAGLTKVSPFLLVACDGLRGVVRAVSLWLVLALVTLPIVGLHAWGEYVQALLNVRPKCGSEVVSASCALGGGLGMAAGWSLAALGVLAATVVPRCRALLLGLAVLAAVPEVRHHYLLIPIMGLAATLAMAPAPAAQGSKARASGAWIGGWRLRLPVADRADLSPSGGSS